MNFRMAATTCLFILASLAFAPSAKAGEILRPAPGTDFQWDSTDCPKPIQSFDPTLSKQERLELYSQAITDHIACLQREAQADFQEAQAAMQAAIEKKLGEETRRMDEMMKLAYRTTR